MARHKYVWTIGLFVLIVGFIDDNSYYNYFLLKKDNAELDKEIKNTRINSTTITQNSDNSKQTLAL